MAEPELTAAQLLDQVWCPRCPAAVPRLRLERHLVTHQLEREQAELADDLRHCRVCGAVCDLRVQVCECGPDCPLPPVQR